MCLCYLLHFLIKNCYYKKLNQTFPYLNTNQKPFAYYWIMATLVSAESL